MMIAGLIALLAGAVAALDPMVARSTSIDSAVWVAGASADTAMIEGDPTKPGLYVQLIRWHPNRMSRPHRHNNVRVITVLRGTWWVGTGSQFDPASTMPMGAGSVVTHLPDGVHYDGAKAEEAIIQIVGIGPVETDRIEQKR